MIKKIIKGLVAALLCLALAAPYTVHAEPCDTESEEVSVDESAKLSEMQQTYEEIAAKWDNMTDKQKNDVYKSLKATIEAEGKFIDKLVKYGILEEADGEQIKTNMMDRFNTMKENKELPIGKPQNQTNNQ